ncbi:hypothetical protein QYE76_010473 [Lolium multiflorum]|uniref:Uncharacterized protein n=1 Tax=Lolium multiflorum TaxID=4521 RepID=A0AAD8TV26_LOLMU|nr:hypothetical protein QYE76_010473 [Lolium multiflorum]
MATADLGSTEWERSKISAQDINLLKKLGISKKKDSLRFPSEESSNASNRPLMKEFIRLGTQFVGYHDHAKKLEANLAEANKRADALALKLEQSEKARKKAESDAAAIEDLQKRLQDAETSLKENIAQQSAREDEILARLESQSRRFVRKTHQDFDLESPEGDRLLDALSLLEIHGDEAREGLADAKAGLLKLFPYFFAKKKSPRLLLLLPSASILKKILGSICDKKA